MSVLEQVRYIWTQGWVDAKKKRPGQHICPKQAHGGRGSEATLQRIQEGRRISDHALDLEEALEVKDLPAADGDEHDGLEDRPELDAVVGRFGRYQIMCACDSQGSVRAPRKTREKRGRTVAV